MCRKQLAKALKKAGLPGAKHRSHSRTSRRAIKAFIKVRRGQPHCWPLAPVLAAAACFNGPPLPPPAACLFPTALLPEILAESDSSLLPSPCVGLLQKGQGTLAGLLQSLQQGQTAEAGRQKRQTELAKR